MRRSTSISTYQSSESLAHAGFTLLEVLIALVILSIGLLGIAALQGVGLRSSHGAYLTSQASLLAYDMADRIRANPDEFTQYNGFVTDCPNDIPDAPLVSADLAGWSCAVDNLLPEGSGTIIGDNTNPNFVRYTIRVEWQDLQSQEVDDDGAIVPWSFVLVIDI